MNKFVSNNNNMADEQDDTLDATQQGQAEAEEGEREAEDETTEAADEAKKEESAIEEAEVEAAEIETPAVGGEEEAAAEKEEAQEGAESVEKPEGEAEEGAEKPAEEGREEGGKTEREWQQVEATDQPVEHSGFVNVEPDEDVADVVVGVESSGQVGSEEVLEHSESGRQSAGAYVPPTESDRERPEGEALEDEEEVVKEREDEEEVVKEREDEEEYKAESDEAEKHIRTPEKSDLSDQGTVVGERLSRGETLELEAGPFGERETLDISTPAPEAEELTDEEKELSSEPTVDTEAEAMEARRQELIISYHEALAVRDSLQQQNYILQNKLSEYFKKKKTDDRQDFDRNVADQEQRYLKYMAQLEDLRKLEVGKKEAYLVQIEEGRQKCLEKKSKVDAERKKFLEFKRSVALKAIDSRSGKPAPAKDIEQLVANEVSKDLEVMNMRLENIKLKNKLKKKEQQLKSREELATGLHMIDFEQLKIENQTYNEKIEERNEELLKFRKKITSTVQVLTHLKEKLQFVQEENLEQTNQLKEVEASLAQSRDILTRTKQARDALRIDNFKLRQKCGLLGNESLLRDFEDQRDEGAELRVHLNQLKMKHSDLTLQCHQVMQKIEQHRHTLM